MQVVFFLFLFLATLLGSHAVVFFSVVHFFSITSIVQKGVIIYSLIFLAISFFLASLIAHFFENIFTRAYYFFSGLWIGLLTNIILACIVLWIISLTSQYINFEMNKGLFGTIFFGVALLISIYGVWNALHPVVKHVTVHIPGIPDEWKGKTIVQISDVHLGHVYQAKFLKNIVEKVNELHPRMVVITGDLFDGMDGRLDSLVQPFNAMNAEKGVFFVTGNHETYLGVETALSALKDTNVVVMKNEVRDIDGLKLIGINYPKRGEKKNVVAILTSLKDQFFGKPSVLLYHAPENIDAMKQSGVNLMLSGHTHQGQQFPFQFITHLVHKGYDYGLYSIGDFTLYTTSGVGTWGPTMRIGTQSEIVAITLE
ncbi:MAG: metallophosphoesterase [Candidatus Moraniibacteriota bacterium]